MDRVDVGFNLLRRYCAFVGSREEMMSRCKIKMSKELVAVFFILTLWGIAPNLGATAQTDRIGTWTGNHTRIVWVQDQGDGTDTLVHRANFKLFCLDSKDGRGERPLLSNINSYFKPMITPDGQKVVVSNRLTRQMYLVDWDSGKVRELGEGVAVAIWEDPKPHGLFRRATTWIYCFSGPQEENKYGTSQPLYRFPLDKPQNKELIWDKTNMSWDNIQLSRDGEVLGGLFPWPYGGVLWTKDKRWQRFGEGCWTSLSPDDSKLLWIFDGLHRNLMMHNVVSGKDWMVSINSAPGIGGFEVYHPRWSNHPRFFVMTGPYEKGEGDNKIGGGGEKVEIYIGRFDERAEKVEQWIQVTNNDRADFYPDMWIEGGKKGQLVMANEKSGVAAKIQNWPTAREHLVFAWEDMKAANQLDEKSPVGFFQCNIELRGRALYTRDLQLATAGGFGETGDAGKKIATALARTGQVSIEFVIEPEAGQQGAILTFSGGGKVQLQLVQEGDTLLARSVTSSAAPVSWPGLLVAGKSLHLVANFDGTSLEVFADGRSVGKKAIQVDVAGASFDSFYLSDTSGSLQAVLSGVAVYDQLLTPTEIAANSSLAGVRHGTGGPTIEPLIVEGTLQEKTDIPAPDAIGAYRRALVVNTYSVDKVVQGVYAQSRILVAEWAILDRNIIKSYQTPAIHERLVLEKFSDQPQLEGERQMMNVFEPELEMYYRIPQVTSK